jgi:hypothetical protein
MPSEGRLAVAPIEEVETEQGKRYPHVKPTFLQKSKYKHLLDDPQVNRWFRNLLRGSAVTAAERLRRLGWLCEHLGTSRSFPS